MEQIIEDHKGQVLLLIAVALGMFMDGLDGSIVNVALPAIASTFNTDTSSVSWVITTYFLVMAGLILIFGRISDKGAIKKVFIFGFAFFSLGSFFCAISPTLPTLLLSRSIQGVGAAMLAASALMLCVKYLPPKIMGFGLAMGVLGSSIGAALGPAMGGILTEFGSWHWVFIINIPIGIFAILFAKKVVPADSGLEKSDFDILGSLLLFVTLVSGLYAIEALPSSGLNTVTLAAMVVFVITFPLFIAWELRSKNPVLNLRLFKLWRFDAVVVSFMLINVCYMGAIYLLPFYLNIEMGCSSLTSGLYLLVPAVMTLLFCSKLSKLSDMTERRIFVVLACVSTIAYLTIFAILNPSMSVLVLIVALLFMGLVWALCGGPAGVRIVENVPEDQKGAGSSFMSFFIYLGGALGTTVFSSLFKIGLPGSGGPISDIASSDFLVGFHFAMAAGIILAVIALVLSAIVNEKKDKMKKEAKDVAKS